jgi:hypothetical protein
MHKFRSTIGFLAIALLACAQASAAGAVQDAAPSDKHSATQSFVPMASKKGGTGIDMSYRLEGTPQVGKPLKVHFHMFSRFDAQATLQADEGLQLVAPEQVMQSMGGVRSQHTVTVVPQAEGRFYISVLSNAQGRSGASAIAVQVGKSAVQLKPTGNVQVMPNGERIISVPAQ